MKKIAALNLTEKTIDLLAERSVNLNSNKSELADVLLGEALEHMSEEEITGLLQEARKTRVRANVVGKAWFPPTKRENAVLAAFLALEEKARDAGVTVALWFHLREISKEAGLYPSETIRALRSLQARGEIRNGDLQDLATVKIMGSDAPYIEHWMRVVKK